MDTPQNIIYNKKERNCNGYGVKHTIPSCTYPTLDLFGDPFPGPDSSPSPELITDFDLSPSTEPISDPETSLSPEPTPGPSIFREG